MYPAGTKGKLDVAKVAVDDVVDVALTACTLIVPPVIATLLALFTIIELETLPPVQPEKPPPEPPEGRFKYVVALIVLAVRPSVNIALLLSRPLDTKVVKALRLN